MKSLRVPAKLQDVFVASNREQAAVHCPTSRATLQRLKNMIVGGVGYFQGTKGIKGMIRSSSISTAASVPSTVSGDIVSYPNDQQLFEASSPQEWATEALQRRGYSTTHINAVSTAYMTRPTDLQLASYDAKTVALATSSDLHQIESLEEILSCGISLNACNAHGETLMHRACRLGYHSILKTFIDLGAELHVCDSQGRTLLHEACWGARPSFQTFALLMRHAPELLFVADCHGACPLDYVQQRHFEYWIDFLDDHQDEFWPVSLAKSAFVSNRVTSKPNSLSISDPPNALSPHLARMVATGRMTPDEVLLLASPPQSFSSGNSMSSISVLSESDDDHTDGSWCEDEEDLIEELAAFLAGLKN